MDGQRPVGRRPDGDRHPGQPASNEVTLVVDTDDAVGIHFPDQVIGAVSSGPYSMDGNVAGYGRGLGW